MTITNGYVTLAQIKDALGIVTSDTQDDTGLEVAVEAASRMIDRRTGRRFYQDADVSTRKYRACRRPGTLLLTDDISTTVGLIVSDNGTMLAASAYQLEPLNSIAQGWPAERIIRLGDNWSYNDREALVSVTARWGWPAVPTDIKQATQILAVRLWKRKDSPEGVLGFADLGSVRLSRMDPDVENLIAPYAKASIG